jgi:hypothetical protein
MESRAQFAQVSSEFLHGTLANSIDTGTIPAPVTSQTTNGPANRGVEANTNRQTGSAPLITGVTAIEYGSNSDAPIVDNYKTRGDN